MNPAPPADSLQFKHIDYLELYVGNAPQAAHFYRTACGFKPVACSGPETDTRDRVSILVEQGQIRLVLTNSLDPCSPIAEHVRLHGDGIKDIAFAVNDVEHAFHETTSRGARPVLEPTVFEDPSGRVTKATVGVYGDTVHSFIQREVKDGAFLPHYKKLEDAPPVTQTGLEEIDHVAISMPKGELDRWIEFYNEVFGFHQSHEEAVWTGRSAMNSKVVQNITGSIKFPIMEPAPGKCKSQIEEFLAFHQGPGAQHVALLTSDIVKTVRALRDNSIEFLNTPAAYYKSLQERVGSLDEDIETLRDLNVLVDRDQWGYLLQIFAKPMQGRPTLFFEIIQRKGAQGFGSGNIKALFEAIEREQTRRGTLTECC
jgi:4-hydroxyphenylpyruvate dioxygenase